MAISAKRATFLAGLGAGLEYYDFIIYGMMAGTLSTLFFSGDEAWIATIKAFGIFSVGYLARPFGGIFFGAVGDVLGRKRVFVTVMLLMALSTIAIGLLPTYEQVGASAAVLLVVLRVFQGISFGAELPGAITVVCEYAEKKSHGAYSGFVVSFVSLGSALASLVLYLVTNNFSHEALLAWAWRIPFILGGLLAIAIYFIRKHLGETPEFLKNQRAPNNPVKLLGKEWLREVILGIGLTLFQASLVIFVIFLPTYLKDYYHYAISDVYLAITCGLIWSAVALPLSGWVADRIGKMRLYAGVSLAFILLGLSLFSMLKGGGLYTLIGFMVIYQTIISLLSVCYFPILVESFPTAVRYTGIAACYNISYSIMGTMPAFVTSLIRYSGEQDSAIWFLIACAFISGVSCLCIIFSGSKGLLSKQARS